MDQQFANHDGVARSFGLERGQALGNGHGKVPAAVIREQARIKLGDIVENGKKNTGAVINRVLNNMPEDVIVDGGRLNFDVEGTGRVMVSRGGGQRGFHRNALGQAAGRFGVPVKYIDSLATGAEENAWGRDLLKHTLNEHAQNMGGRYLMRSVDGEVRGFLSDRYRRLDSRPLLNAFVEGCDEVGAIPFEGVATDLRSSVRAIVPKVYEPTEGECMVFGLSWTNSDFGAGTYQVSAFVLRLICDNGLVTESQMKQVHLGGRLPDNLVFSAETYAKDTETMTLATRDIVRAALSTGSMEDRAEAIAAAASDEEGFDIVAGIKKAQKTLTKGETKAVKEAYEGGDVLMLPAGNTAWRFSNALSWVANSAEDPERKLELQRLAGAVIPKAA